MAYFPESFMTFRLQRANSTTQWTQGYITAKILRTTCMPLKLFLCMLRQLHVTSRKTLPQKSFNSEILLFSCLKTQFCFLSPCQKNKQKTSSYSAIRFGASPNKAEVSRQSGARTHTRPRARAYTHTHSLPVLQSHAYADIYTHATSLPSEQHSLRISVAQ